MFLFYVLAGIFLAVMSVFAVWVWFGNPLERWDDTGPSWITVRYRRPR